MSEKHTPGPWVLIRGGDGPQKFVVADDCGVSLLTIIEEDGVNFAAVYEDADARLIAAAPELLEALKGLDEAYCRAGTSLTREERSEDRRRLIATRAAIAKATGEAA